MVMKGRPQSLPFSFPIPAIQQLWILDQKIIHLFLGRLPS